MAHRNTFTHELESSEPSDVGSTETQKDDSESYQTQKDLFIKQRMQAYVEHITKEIPEWIQESVTEGTGLQCFMKDVETAVRSENTALAKRWWEQWWEAYNSTEKPFSWYAKEYGFDFVVPMLNSMQRATADSLLFSVLEEVHRQQKTMDSRYFAIKFLNEVVDWCIQNKLIAEGWRLFESHTHSLFDKNDASDSLLLLCVASVQQGFVDSVEDLGPRLDKVRVDDPKRLNNLLEQLFAKVSFETAKSSVDEQPQTSYLTPKQMLELQSETMPREDVVLDRMGQDGWECFQVSIDEIRSKDNVVLYFKRPKSTSLDAAQLKPSVQAFFTK